MRYINQSLVHIIMLLFHRHIDLYDCFKSTIALEDKTLEIYMYIVFCFVLRWSIIISIYGLEQRMLMMKTVWTNGYFYDHDHCGWMNDCHFLLHHKVFHDFYLNEVVRLDCYLVDRGKGNYNNERHDLVVVWCSYVSTHPSWTRSLTLNCHHLVVCTLISIEMDCFRNDHVSSLSHSLTRTQKP